MLPAICWGTGGKRDCCRGSISCGAAYAFHITLTWQILKTRQTDITSQGCLFSAVVIFLGNALVLLLALPVLTGQDLLNALQSWFHCNHLLMHRLANML